MTWRHEYKHYIDTADWISLRHRLKSLMQTDRHADTNGEYLVRSLYFENFEDRILNEKLDGLNHREKFRIRLYDHDPSSLRLERKTKHNGMGMKESAGLTPEQCRMLVAGDTAFVEETGNPLMMALKSEMDTKLLRAGTMVDYTREAFVMEQGNVRVTFDREIRTGLTGVDVLDPNLPTIPSIHPDLIVLEVKYDAYLPSPVAEAVQTGDRRAGAISKYAMCRMRG